MKWVGGYEGLQGIRQSVDFSGDAPLFLHNPVDVCSLHKGVSFVCAVAQVQHQGGFGSYTCFMYFHAFLVKIIIFYEVLREEQHCKKGA